MQKNKDKLISLPLEKIKVTNVKNIADLNFLTQSIKAHGLVNPIIVRKKNGYYQIVSGKKRVLACRRIGMQEITAIVRNYSNFEAETLAIVESFQKRELHFLEKANFIQSLMIDWNMDVEEISEYIQIPLIDCKRKIMLTKLNSDEWDLIFRTKLSENQSLSSLKIIDLDIRKKFLQYICDENLSDKQSETLSKNICEIPKKRIIKRSLPKDLRLFLNNIDKTVNSMIETGFEVTKTNEEDEKYIKCTLNIKKDLRIDKA